MYVYHSKLKQYGKILWIEALGFLGAIILHWLVEILDLPHILFNTTATPFNFAEAIIETVYLLILAIGVLIFSKIFLKRILYLAGFVRICSRCKKVFIKGKWISIEEYLRQVSDSALTHGLCESCFDSSTSTYIDSLKKTIQFHSYMECPIQH